MGVQEPALRRVPKAARKGAFSFGHRAVELSEAAGRRVIPWQQGALIDIQTVGDDGLWAASEAVLLASRQNGKNGVVESLELDWMSAEPGVRIAHTAHEFKTAMKSLNKLEALIRGLPGADVEPGPKNSILKSVRRSHGEEGIYFHNGSYCEFSTRTKSAGRGTSYDRLIIDEAMIYTPESQAALEPLVNTAPNGQIIYTGSAPDADSMEYCQAWADLYYRALEDDDEDSLCFLGWLCPPGADPDDRREWARSNPSLGYLITERTLAARRRSMRSNVRKFCIEYMSIGTWPKQEEGPEPVFSGKLWADMTNLDPTLTGPIAIAVDRSHDGRWWAIAAAQRTDDGRIHLEVGYFRSAANSAVVDYLLKIIEAWDPCVLIIDRKSPAKVLEPLLIAAGIEPEMTGAPQMATACVGFLDAATDMVLSHTDQPALTEALENAAKRTMPGGDWAWDRLADAIISPLVAATLAHYGLLTFGVEPVANETASPSTGNDLDHAVEEFDALSAAF